MFEPIIKAIKESVTPNSITVRDKQYVTEKVYLPPDEKMVADLDVSSLTALRDYILQKVDNLSAANLLIHVCGPRKVEILEQVETKEGTRHKWVEATVNLKQFRFNDFMSQEQFLVSFQCLFLDEDDFRNVVQTVSNIVAEQSISNSDDGMSQEAVVKQSAVKAVNCVIKNPVILRPIRTFHEVDQPESPFILRFKQIEGNILVALFEADNGKWENAAMLSIKNWLDEEINEKTSIDSALSILA